MGVLLSCLYFQVAIKIIDKTQLNPGSLQKVRLLDICSYTIGMAVFLVVHYSYRIYRYDVIFHPQ